MKTPKPRNHWLVVRISTGDHPLNTWRNNNVVITSKRRHFDVLTSKWRRCDVITTSLSRDVSAGQWIPSHRASNEESVSMLSRWTSTGNMYPYLTSYIRAYSKPSDLDDTTVVWVGALSISMHGFLMFVGGLISRKIGIRLAVLIGCVLMTYVTILDRVPVAYVQIRIMSSWRM